MKKNLVPFAFYSFPFIFLFLLFLYYSLIPFHASVFLPYLSLLHFYLFPFVFQLLGEGFKID